jgi:hypothetical protein
MAELVRVRGLARRGIRIGRTSGGAAMVANNKTRVIDLDDGVTRRELAHHAAIGQVAVVGDAPYAVQSGVVTTNGTTTTVTVSAGVLLLPTGGTRAVAGVTNQAITAADATNPRIDLVLVNLATGAITLQAGTAAASPQAPVSGTYNLYPIASIRVAANAAAPADVVITDLAYRL